MCPSGSADQDVVLRSRGVFVIQAVVLIIGEKALGLQLASREVAVGIWEQKGDVPPVEGRLYVAGDLVGADGEPSPFEASGQAAHEVLSQGFFMRCEAS